MDDLDDHPDDEEDDADDNSNCAHYLLVLKPPLSERAAINSSIAVDDCIRLRRPVELLSIFTAVFLGSFLGASAHISSLYQNHL